MKIKLATVSTLIVLSGFSGGAKATTIVYNGQPVNSELSTGEGYYASESQQANPLASLARQPHQENSCDDCFSENRPSNYCVQVCGCPAESSFCGAW